MKKLTDKIISEIEDEVILKLLCCAEQEENKGRYMWNLNNGYYCEAFGIMVAMVALGYCYFGGSNTPKDKRNAKWWFLQLKCAVEDLKKQDGYEKPIEKYNKKVSNNRGY